MLAQIRNVALLMNKLPLASPAGHGVKIRGSIIPPWSASETCWSLTLSTYPARLPRPIFFFDAFVFAHLTSDLLN
jgi:hypothetical protein